MVKTQRVFRSPRDIVWGRGTFSHLSEIPGKRVLIVTDQVMTKLGVTAKATGFFRKGGMETRVFDEVEPEPLIDTIKKILEEHCDFRPDVIAGIGGGSSIDASKAFRIFYEHPKLTFETIRYLESSPKVSIPPFKKTTHVAVASTSGTGSDVSYICVITDPRISEKCPILSSELIPDIAIVDPDIADTMPPALLADSGLDALTHAIESYVSVRANDFSRGLSLQAIVLIMKYLLPAFARNDSVAKEHMHYAATIAGIAFSNSANGICHAIADKIGMAFKLSHGRANAIALPYSIKFNSLVAGNLFSTIAKALGYQGENSKGAVEDLIQRISELRRQLRVPGSYKEAGISESVYDSRLEEFTVKASTFPATVFNPRQPTLGELESLFKTCYQGDYNSL
jgi:alcohol dehydrogenase class IV